MKSETPSPASHRLKKWLLLLLLPPLALLIVLLLVLTTEFGFRTLLRAADLLSGPVFSVEEIEGRLMSRWRLGKVQLHIDKVVDTEVNEMVFDWAPLSLLDKKLVFHQIAVDGLLVQLTGEAKKEEQDEKDGSVSLPTLNLPVDIELGELHLRDGQIFFSGQKKPLVLKEILLQATALSQQQETEQYTLVNIKRIKLDLRDYGVDLQGKVAFHDAWPLQLKGKWQVADPGINDLDGTVDAQGDLDDLGVLLTLVAPAEVSLEGKVVNILNDLHWKVAAKTGHFHLNDIKVNVPVDGTLSIVEASGTVGSYQGILAADIHYEGYPPVRAEAKVIAEDYAGLAIEYLSIFHQESSLTTRGKMQWAGGFSWQAELESKEFDPALVAANWPGKLNGLIESQGHLAPSGTSLEVNIKSLDGELVGYPVQGSGGMTLNDQGMLFDDLQIQAGSAQAELDGRIAKDNSLDLKVLAESNDLSAFFPEYAGSIHLQGTAIGNQENPGVDLVLEGSGLHVAGYELNKLQAELHADLTMEGDERGMKINAFHLLTDEDMSLDLIGQLGWSEGLTWQAELTGNELNPGLILPQWPGKIQTKIRSQGTKNSEGILANIEFDQLQGTLQGLPLSGSGGAEIDGKKILIDALQLQSGSTRVDIDGQTNEQDLRFTIQARSDDLSPFMAELRGGFELKVQAQGKVTQPQVTVALTGSELVFQNYAFKHLQTDLKANILLEGKEQGATIDDLAIILDKKSKLAANGKIVWSNGISWFVDLSGEQLDPSLFFPEWSGDIQAAIHSQGKKNGDELTAQVQIKELEGNLRDLPLSGSGKAELKSKQLLVDNIRLGLGAGKLQVSGSADLAKEFDLHFEGGADDLAPLLPGAEGKIQVQGSLKGLVTQPDLDVVINADKVHYEGYQLNRLKGKIKADLAEKGLIDADLKADGIRVKDEEINEVSLQVKGSTDKHTVELSFAGTPGKGQLAAAGGLKELVWQGGIKQLEFDHDQLGKWAMWQSAGLKLSAKEAALSGFDLRHKELKITLDGTWKQKGAWQVQGAIDNFALKLLQEWQLPTPDFEGTASARLSAQGRGAQPEQVDISVELPKLSLTTESFEDDGEKIGTTVWVWTDNIVEVKLQDKVARLHARTQFQDSSDADLELLLTNCGELTQPEKMPLSGQLDINLKDLKPFAHLTNEAVMATGEFGGQVSFGGTARKPTVNGKLALGKGKEKQGEVFVSAAGIGLQDIQVALEGDSLSNKVNVQLRSGEGSIELTGTAQQDAEQHWLADIVISGNNFQAADLPEYRAIISPDLRLHYEDTETRLSGTVTVDEAEIAPTGFSGALSSSGDVIVVDDEESTKGTSPVHLDLKVIMGENVLVNTFGLRGYLDGSLKIKAKPGRPIIGIGNLALRDGTFDFEGNMLALSQSRVFYQGGPIDEPGLDIQASRKIDKVELGVRLTGTPNNMDMRLFSDSAMDDSEILSYLLTGQDISKSSSNGEEKALSPAAATLGKLGGGVLLKTVDPLKTLDMEGVVDLSIGGGEDASDVSLVMGKEIYKDLYISYGKDLTGAGGTFKARYDLKYGFSVETATNAKTSGADLLFSLEN